MKILDARVKPQDFVRTWWVCSVEAGTTRQEVLEPDFWAYVSMKFKREERIEIITDDCEWMGEYLIMDCDRTFAKIKELNWWYLGSKVPSNKLGYEYFWGGRYGKHGIRRISDGELMVNKLESKKDAMAWLTVHLESINNGNIET